MAFMKNIAQGLWKKMRGGLAVKSICTTHFGMFNDEILSVREMLMNFNLPRSAEYNLKEKKQTRSFIKRKFHGYGAKVSIQNFTHPRIDDVSEYLIKI